MNLTLVTGPVCEPMTLTEVQGQTRLPDLSMESSTVELMIEAVREAAEGVTNRALVTQVWEITIDAFPGSNGSIQLPMPPLQSVQFIKYLDVDGVEQTLDPLAYRVIAETSPNCGNGYVIPAYGLTWPSTQNYVATVTIRFTCGYGPISPDTSLNIPKGIIQWIAINVANVFENRETVGIAYRETKFDITDSICDGLIAKYRVVRL